MPGIGVSVSEAWLLVDTSLGKSNQHLTA
jgi:hypothetical protein